MTNEDKIRRAFAEKDWHEIKAGDSWQIFKIMAEFVDGFEKMAKIGPCVSVFGSARTKPENKYYKLAEEISEKLCKEGYGVISGGGPGIMEAANKGAQAGKGKSVGLNIRLPFEQSANIFVDFDKLVTFDYFFVRKTIFLKYSQGFIAMPGGFGTLDELTEALTLIQTRKILQFPIVLMGRDYWAPFVAMYKTMVEAGTISAADLDLMLVTDSVPDAMAHIELHAVQHFGLKRRRVPRPRKIFGETSLNADTRRSS